MTTLAPSVEHIMNTKGGIMARKRKKGKVRAAIGVNGVACVRGRKVRVTRVHRKRPKRLPLFDALGKVVKTFAPPTMVETGAPKLITI